MTGSAGPGPDAWPPARPTGRVIVRAMLRALASTAALVAVYYLLPLDHSSRWLAITILMISLAALMGLVTGQMVIDVVLGLGARVVNGRTGRPRSDDRAALEGACHLGLRPDLPSPAAMTPAPVNAAP